MKAKQTERKEKTKQDRKITSIHGWPKYCTTPRVNVEPAAMQGFFFSVECGQE